MGDEKTPGALQPLRRPLKTPLFEVSAEMHFALEPVVEFPARTFYDAIREQYPVVQGLPVFLIAEPQRLGPQNLHAPAYRFYDTEASRAVQVGPRMVALNALTWKPGYEDYREAACRVMESYARTNPKAPVIRFSLGFYNRIPAADLAEALDIINIPLTSRETASFKDLFWQVATTTDAGSVLSQIIAMPPDERTPESYLSVNNIVRFDFEPARHFVDALSDWPRWFDRAHEIAKNVFWDSLTPAARASWKEEA